jgi:EAL domain-containing protein (putative c-di-GMP-specific phosphodiesterase class I)
VHPRTFSDPSFRQGQTQRLIEAENLKPEQIVFEITEHQAVEDYALFNRLIDHYRNQGFKIAIDDTGAGYSGLVTLMEVKPDFVKVDMALVRSIHEDDTKRSIVAAINTVSRGFGATVIAEGIETLEEYRAVIDCGVECGQGYLFGRPGAAMGLSPFWTGIPQ